jgi:hypothetical protein
VLPGHRLEIFQFFDTRRIRAATELPPKPIQFFLGSGGCNFDRSVLAVPHPPAQLEATRGNARKPPEANSLHPARDQNVHRRHQDLPSHSEKYRERRGHRSLGLHAVEIVDDQLSGSYPPRNPVESFGNLLRAWGTARRSIRSGE